MLPLSKFRVFESTSPLAAWHQRLPDTIQTIGPHAVDSAITYPVVWEGVRSGNVVTMQYADSNFQLELPEEAGRCCVAFDLNGRVHWGYALGDEVVWNFFDHRTQGYERIVFEGSYPVASLDSLGPRVSPPVDVALVYHREDCLYVRYQRERYTVEHVIGVVPEGAVLRTMGMNIDNRWVFRFYRQLPPDFTMEIADGS